MEDLLRQMMREYMKTKEYEEQLRILAAECLAECPDFAMQAPSPLAAIRN